MDISDKRPHAGALVSVCHPDIISILYTHANVVVSAKSFPQVSLKDNLHLISLKPCHEGEFTTNTKHGMVK